jgi:hypothetical protein
MVIKLLDNNKENKDVTDIAALIKDLKTVYDKITIKSSKIQAVVDEKLNETNLKSTSSSNISQEVFVELREAVKTIRTNFTL